MRRWAAAGTIATLFLASACSAGSGGSRPSLDPCADARTTAAQFHQTASQAETAYEAAQASLGPLATASPYDDVAYFAAISKRDVLKKAWGQDLHLYAHVISGNPACFDAATRAEADDFLAKDPG